MHKEVCLILTIGKCNIPNNAVRRVTCCRQQCSLCESYCNVLFIFYDHTRHGLLLITILMDDNDTLRYMWNFSWHAFPFNFKTKTNIVSSSSKRCNIANYNNIACLQKHCHQSCSLFCKTQNNNYTLFWVMSALYISSHLHQVKNVQPLLNSRQLAGTTENTWNLKK